MKTINIVITSEIDDQLKELASFYDRSKSSLVRNLITNAHKKKLEGGEA